MQDVLGHNVLGHMPRHIPAGRRRMRLASTAVALAVLAACGGAVPLAGRAQNVQDYRVFLGV